MQMNLRNRVKKNTSLSPANCLLPLFEAIMNSIHGIEEGKCAGQIIVTIMRRDQQGTLGPDHKPGTYPVIGFSIEDNGVGFTEANFRSFSESDSDHKERRGGKGVGRLYWLKAFQRARVESTYRENGKTYRRSFDFELTDNGVEHHSFDEVADAPNKTIVNLLGFFPDYQKACKKHTETIARKIIEHFVGYLVQRDCPQIILRDPFEAEIPVNSFFRDKMLLESTHITIKVARQTFTINHLRIATTQIKPDHVLTLCANGRSVEAYDLSKIVPNLAAALNDGSQPFAYAGYLHGKLLDDRVSDDRTRFNLRDEGPLFPMRPTDDEPSRQQLANAAVNAATKFLDKYLDPLRETALERIKTFVQERPRYRPLLKLRPEWINAIHVRSDLKDEDLDLELYRLSKKLEVEVQEEGVRVRQEQGADGAVGQQSIEKRKNHLGRYLDEWNQVGISKLAEYVIHRKATLDFLAECQRVQPDGKYKLEEVVHEVIFPMHISSEELVEPDLNNLWIIDERLAYHRYLSSDLQFNQIKPVRVQAEGSAERMDIFVLREYERAHAFVDSPRPFHSMTIIELKRPMRTDYVANDDERDPIEQVWRYVQRLRDGDIKDVFGQFIEVHPDTPFYAYIVCTMTKKMKQMALGHQFTPTPDGLGLYNYHTNYKVYTEVISFDKLLKDARQRNQAFFEKLMPLQPYIPKPHILVEKPDGTAAVDPQGEEADLS